MISQSVEEVTQHVHLPAKLWGCESNAGTGGAGLT